MSVKIKSVTSGSHAEKCGIKSGEILETINGYEIMDVLDYGFYQANSHLTLTVADSDGNKRNIELKKREYEEIGLEFETYLMDKQHSCKNKCIFCFIDQLPKGMRPSLYFKDDDSRLSFLFGNYVTLTNLTEHEIDRICKMHISPINVSVHTTNPELRVKMMGNRFAGRALGILKRFADAQIKINCQIVACPGINDGDELLRTFNDLEGLFPSVESIAIVPVGLTRYREGLFPLTEYNKETAADTLRLINKFGDKCVEKYGRRIAYASDEFYLKAQEPIPNEEFYGEFDQLENGVGLITLMQSEFDDELEYTEKELSRPRTVSLATGEGVEDFMRSLAEKAEKKFDNLTVQVFGIKNNFFGGGVNVSGLVTGGDLIAQLKEKKLGDELLIPSVMLRREGDIFLDDVSIDEVRNQLDIKISTVVNDGGKLLNAMLGG